MSLASRVSVHDYQFLCNIGIGRQYTITALGENRRVAFVEEFYGLIQEVHEKELLHAGYKKTFNKVI